MNPNHDHYPEGEALHRSLSTRYRYASFWQALFFSALVIAMCGITAGGALATTELRVLLIE